MVALAGLEPAQILGLLDFESNASANSAIRAYPLRRGPFASHSGARRKGLSSSFKAAKIWIYLESAKSPAAKTALREAGGALATVQKTRRPGCQVALQEAGGWLGG